MSDEKILWALCSSGQHHGQAGKGLHCLNVPILCQRLFRYLDNLSY